MQRWLMALAALAAITAGCSDDECTTDGECPDGRICRLGLCAVDPDAPPTTGAGETGDGGGALDCPPAQPGDLVLTEILADAGGADVDGDGTPSSTGDEFVEVVNFAGTTVGTANVAVRIGDKDFPLAAVCLAPTDAQVLWGSAASLGLTNSGKTVSLLVDGEVSQTHTYGSEADKDQSVTLAVQSDPDGGWVQHRDVAPDHPWSPGTCPNGVAFPDCGAGAGDTGAGTGDTGDAKCEGADPQEGDLVLNEILIDPGKVNDANGDGTSDATDDEFIEVVNTSGATLSLTGVTLGDGGAVTHTFDAEACLAPGRAVLVLSKWEGTGHFGDALVVDADKGLSLANSADSVVLTAAGGVVLDSVQWGAGAGVSSPDDESLTRAVDGDSSAAWIPHGDHPAAAGATMSPARCASGGDFPECGGAPVVPDATGGGDATTGDVGPDDTGGTPVCGTFAAPGDLVINEILSDPGGLDPNGDGVAENTGDEFIEIVHVGDGPVDIDGVLLETGSGTLEVMHTFGAACLESHQGLVVFGGGSPALDLQYATVIVGDKSLSLNNGGDSVVVRARDGAEIDAYTYGSVDDQSWVRDPDGSGDFVKHTEATGSQGAAFSPGLCVDGSPLPACL